MTPPPQDAPAINIQRASTEISRKGSVQAAGTKKKVILNENLTKWLQLKGIPIYNEPMKKLRKTDGKNSTKNITASNVSTAELTKHLKWAFHSSFSMSPYPSIELYNKEVVSRIKSLGELHDLESRRSRAPRAVEPEPLFHLPMEWKINLRKESDLLKQNHNYWIHNVLLFLSLHDPDGIYHKFISQPSDQKNVDASTGIPKISLMYNHTIRTGGIGWALCNFLACPIFNSGEPGTERSVEHLFGPGLSGFFNAPDYKNSSNAQLTFKNEITCFGSHPRPDFAVRIQKGTIEDKRIQDRQLHPVGMLGEAKRLLSMTDTEMEPDSNTLQVPTNRPSQSLSVPTELPGTADSRLVAQLAFSAYPSLVVIIASLISHWESEDFKKTLPKKPTRKDYQIPGYAIIYGVGYGSNGVLLYAFFPYVTGWNDDNFPNAWGFMSALLSDNFVNTFESFDRNNIIQRFQLVGTLLRMQQQAIELKENMKKMKLPGVFFDATVVEA